MGFTAELNIAQALARQLNVGFVDLKHHNFKANVALKLPESSARRFRALALEERGAKMLVGMADPTDLFAFDELSRILKKDIEPVVVAESEVAVALEDRKSTRLNSSHITISYAVFCLKKKYRQESSEEYFGTRNQWRHSRRQAI